MIIISLGSGVNFGRVFFSGDEIIGGCHNRFITLLIFVRGWRIREMWETEAKNIQI